MVKGGAIYYRKNLDGSTTRREKKVSWVCDRCEKEYVKSKSIEVIDSDFHFCQECINKLVLKFKEENRSMHHVNVVAMKKFLDKLTLTPTIQESIHAKRAELKTC